MRVAQLDGQCGIDLCVGLTPNPKEILEELHGDIVGVENEHCGCDECEGHSEEGELLTNVMFTDVVGPKSKPSNGQKLAAYIKREKLGTLQVTKPIKNLGNGNMFQIYVWTPNAKFVKNYG